MIKNISNTKISKIKKIRSIFFTIALCALSLCLAFCPQTFAKAAKKAYRPYRRIAVSNLFLYDAAKFIAKPEVFSVRNIGNGYPGSGDILITMTSNQKRFASRNKSLTFFATSKGYNGGDCEYDYYDPAKIPFIILNVMKAISSNDPKNYPHYQKRLAIYQSILDSTLQVWKKNLKNLSVLDLTVHTGFIFSTGATKCVKPPREVLEAWKSGDIAHLQATIEQANQRHMLIVTDFATDPVVTQNVQKLAKKHFHMLKYQEGSFSSYLADNFGMLKKLLNEQTKTENSNANNKKIKPYKK